LTVVAKQRGQHLADLVCWGKTDLYATSERVRDLYQQENAQYVVVDDDGVGGGVTDILRKMKIPVEKMEFLMTTLLDMTKDQNRITIDGIKIIRNTGWILIRPSGTEPIYRCFSEGPTKEKSDMLCDEGIALIEKALTQS